MGLQAAEDLYKRPQYPKTVLNAANDPYYHQESANERKPTNNKKPGSIVSKLSLLKKFNPLELLFYSQPLGGGLDTIPVRYRVPTTHRFKQHKKKTKLDDGVCSSGIRGEVGNCWICSRESYFPLTNQKELAEKYCSLGGCKGQKAENYKYKDFYKRWAAYIELGIARDEVNACFFPPHEPHLKQARNAHEVANHCLSRASRTNE